MGSVLSFQDKVAIKEMALLKELADLIVERVYGSISPLISIPCGNLGKVTYAD